MDQRLLVRHHRPLRGIMLLLVFLFLSSSASYAADEGKVTGRPIHFEQNIIRGIELLYEGEYEKAEDLFCRATLQYPKDPKGYFYLSMVTWSRLVAGFWTKHEVEEYRCRIDKAISVAKKKIAKDEDDSWAYFYLGGALGFKGRFQLMQRKWLSSLFLALDAVEALKTCRSLDPENRDVLLGLGIFDYYTSKLSGVLKFLSYILITRGGKEEGLRKLHIAAEEGVYSTIESKSILLHIYLFMESEYHKALPLAHELATRFETNPRYIFFEGITHIMLKKEHEYRDVVLSMERKGASQSSKSLADTWYNQARYLRACSQLIQNRPQEARTILHSILDHVDAALDPAMVAWPLLKIGMSYDLEGKREKALDYYERIVRMENGAGAQFLAEKYISAPIMKGDAFLGY